MPPDHHPSPPAAAPTSNGKLGLALSGGGFRASLFHAGVLHRLAELDVLRRVQVLSTVSGGSITGALYVLLLKERLEHDARLSREDYVALVEELEKVLRSGVRKDLRTRLFMNPLGMLLVLLTGDSLGRRMARLYERYLFRHVVEKLEGVTPPPWWRPAWLWPGQMPMEDLRARPGGDPIRGGLADYNAAQLADGGSVVTSVVFNATTLNSGGRFHFSGVELGDWYLGYFREDEFGDLLARKALLALDDDDLLAVADGAAPPDGEGWRDADAARSAALMHRRRRWERDPSEPASTAERGASAGASGPADPWAPLMALPGFPGRLDDTPFGLLRRAKLSAWHLRVGAKRTPPALGGRALHEHRAAFWSALDEIDPDLREMLQTATATRPDLESLLLDFVLELYLIRTAERVSPRIREDWKAVRVGHAVGASACFPPVFPPFVVYGVYDDLFVSRLGLTDGGVYDNVGVTGLLDEGCTQIIASDTSGLFTVTPEAEGGRLGLAGRVPSVLMRALAGVQRAALRERRRVSRELSEALPPPESGWSDIQRKLSDFRAGRALDSLVYFHIDSPAVEPPPGGAVPGPPLELVPRAEDVAALRTDLDGFGDAEIHALVNHGYDMADRYVRRYGPELVPGAAPPPRVPLESGWTPEDAGRVRRILAAGRSRLFRSLKLRSAVAWAFSIAAILLAVGLAWRAGLTLAGAMAALSGLVSAQVAWFDAMLGWLPGLDAEASRSPLVFAALLLLAAAAVLGSAARLPRPRKKGQPHKPFARRALSALKWLRTVRGNVLWAFLGLPLILAAASAVAATASYVFYHLPFLAATRVPGEGKGSRTTSATATLAGDRSASEVDVAVVSPRPETSPPEAGGSPGSAATRTEGAEAPLDGAHPESSHGRDHLWGER